MACLLTEYRREGGDLNASYEPASGCSLGLQRKGGIDASYALFCGVTERYKILRDVNHIILRSASGEILLAR